MPKPHTTHSQCYRMIAMPDKNLLKVQTSISLLLAFLSLLAASTSPPAKAQSITAAPDSTGTSVQQDGSLFNIDGGTLSGDGANLFHSFEQFGLSSDETANFLSNPQIQNILGRVVGGDASIINGLVQVTGGNSNLFLLNPVGIIFGSNASLNVPASFSATTANAIGLEGGWFNAQGDNNYQALIGNPNSFAFSLSEPGTILNAGELAVGSGENLSLLAGKVINTGTLSAPGGNITIAAVPGQKLVRISQTGMVLSLEIEPIAQVGDESPSPVAGITPTNLPGLLSAAGNIGNATGVILNPDGTFSLTGSGVSLTAEGGLVVASGNIDASHTDQLGGNIQILGDRLDLIATNIDASGSNGGGKILIGGDYRGQGTIPLAGQTSIDADSLIKADALTNGNGGQVIVFAQQNTEFFGTISTRGGSQAGDGGFVEISGRENLAFQGEVDTSAAKGNFGTLLFDPVDISIIDGIGDGDTTPPPDGPNTFAGEPSGTPGQVVSGDTRPNTIFRSELESLAGNTNIILEATNNITLDNNVALNLPVGSGSITFTADADGNNAGSFVMQTGSSLNSNGRPLTIAGANIALAGSEINSNGGNITLDGPVRLGSDLNLSTGTGLGDITFTSSIDGDTTGSRNLAIAAGMGNVSIAEDIGTTSPLASLDISGSNVQFANYTGGPLNITAQESIQAGVITARQYERATQLFSFESGDFTDWTTIGNASIETAAFGSGPTEGTFQGRVTSAGGSVGDANLETFLAAPAGSLDAVGNGNVTQGSAIQVTFAGQEGDTISFDWNFLTDELDQNARFNDFSFITLTAPGSPTSVSVLTTRSSTPIGTGVAGFDGETGFQSSTIPLPANGNYTLGVGVVDIADQVVSSAVLIDNLALTTPAPTSGAPVTLSAGGDVEVVSIDTQGPNGLGGAIDINAGGLFQATGNIIDQNGVTASISSAGSAGGGAIAIEHSGGPNNLPFSVGNASQNGTAAAITTGASSILPQQLFPNPGTVNPVDNISITFVNEPPSLTANSPLTGAEQNQVLSFSEADVNPLVNDANEDVTSVVVGKVLQGRLTKNGIEVKAGTILESGDVLVYTPPRNTSGSLDAFTILASDNISFSTPFPIVVKVTPEFTEPVEPVKPLEPSQPPSSQQTLETCQLALKPLEVREEISSDGEQSLVVEFEENNCRPSSGQTINLELPQQQILMIDEN
ncbi:MAG: filamentous hemagglutinin N-terminal domain-containing protein [Coleofasciculaceae cyanobacterium]